MATPVQANILLRDRSLGDLIIRCEVRALASRIVQTVTDFFVCIARKIGQAVSALSAATSRIFCPKSNILEVPVISPPSKRVPEAVLVDRRKVALERLEQLKLLTNDQFQCSPTILQFDLEEILQKYNGDQPLSKWNSWFQYARPSREQWVEFTQILRSFQENPHNEQYQLVRNLLSKLHCILTEKHGRIQALPSEQRGEAHRQLKEDVGYIICRLIDADSNCIDQTLNQLEEIVLIAVGSELPQSETRSFLQTKAAYILFQFRMDCFKRLLMTDPDPEIRGNAHQADLDREIKKRAADCLGLKGKICEAGGQFAINFADGFTEGLVQRATNNLCERFYQQYEPSVYLQTQSQTLFGNCKKFRNELMQWAQEFYGLGSKTVGEDEVFDELSKAVAKNPEDLDAMMSISAVELTTPGIQLFLEATGIIQVKN